MANFNDLEKLINESTTLCWDIQESEKMVKYAAFNAITEAGFDVGALSKETENLSKKIDKMNDILLQLKTINTTIDRQIRTIEANLDSADAVVNFADSIESALSFNEMEPRT